MNRHTGIHPFARVGGRPEAREWIEDHDLPCFAPIVDTTALVKSHVTIDAGCKEPTRVGARTLCAAHSHVGHDCQIGADVELATGCIIGGFAQVEDGAKVGLGAIVLPFRTVGAGAVVGAGSVVTRDIPPGATVCGNPARLIDRNPIPFTEREAGREPDLVLP